MRKLLFILLIFCGFQGFGQGWNYSLSVRGMFAIDNTNPKWGHGSPIDNNIDSAYNCDSVYFYVDYTEYSPPLGPDAAAVSIQLNYAPFSNIPYNDFKKMLIPSSGGTGYKVKFKIPCDSTTNKLYNVTIGSIFKSTPGEFYIKEKSTTTGIINPLLPSNNIKIHYYNTQGLEREKPTEGLYIWKSENGESGKIYIY